MNNLKQMLLGGSAIAVATAGAFSSAYAQDATASIDTVEVSASRINLQGFAQPTPVTVIGLETIQRDAKINIGDEIRELPQVRGGSSINSGSNARCISQGDAGVDTVSIRGLGGNRNLVLFDRQRVPQTDTTQGTVDLGILPNAVVSRVDVVTGGASAAWGSDAVTGVINLVINKTFEGFKGSAQYSNNTEVQWGVGNPTYKAELTWGAGFFNDRLHTLWSGNWTIHNATVFGGQIPANRQGRSSVYNPAWCNTVTYVGAATTGGTCTSFSGQPMTMFVSGAGANNTTGGGVVNTDSAGTTGSNLAANGLKGIMFVGPNSTPGQFNYGTGVNLSTSSTCYNGCTNDQNTGLGQFDPFLVSPYHQANYFNYTSFQVTPDIKASIQINYARFSTRTFGGEQTGTKTIRADNAFLPQAIQERFVCNGVASASCVTTLSNGYNPFTQSGGSTATPTQYAAIGFDILNNAVVGGNSGSTATQSIFTLDNLCRSVGTPCSFQNKVFMRGVFTLDGTLSDDWTWNAYIQSGTNRLFTHVVQDPVTARLNNAIDAVLVTSSNVGTTGLPIGSIQCRVRLNGTAPQGALPTGNGPTQFVDDVSGCQPANIFGYQNISNAAIRWIEPGTDSANTGIQNTAFFINYQTSAGISVNGVLPWKLPAGEVAVATGFEYREEGANVGNYDPYSQSGGGYSAGNVPAWHGAYNVMEGFLELAAPLLKDVPLAQDLEADVAGRITSYSTSGLVQTWKIGLTDQINDDWKVRGTMSYDIRAPTVADLFTAGNVGGVTCSRLFPADSSLGTNPCFGVSGGNPNLQPERADTYTVGIVATPHWIPGLTASVDWYQIHLHGGITGTNTTTARQNCILGITDFTGCGALAFQNPLDTHSQILTTYSVRVNAALLTTEGMDIALNYGFDMADVSWGVIPGHLNLGLNNNYVWDFTQVLSGETFNGAGGGGFYSGGPKYQGTLSVDYRIDKWNWGLNVRMTGASQGDLGIEPQFTQLVPLVYRTVTYQKVNGVDVATIGSGQGGYSSGTYTIAGPYNDSDFSAVPDFRVSYKIDDNYTAGAAIDNFLNLPGDQSLRRGYRVYLRFNF